MLEALKLSPNAVVVRSAGNKVDVAIAKKWTFPAPTPFVGPVEVRAWPAGQSP